MKIRYKIVTVILTIVFLIPVTASAHPGRTASDGCHYCRTNCDSWGVPWNARHCHGGYTPPSPSSGSTTQSGKIGTTLEFLSSFPVTEVIDGDTIKIKDTDGDIETVRMVGIDTPETVHPSKPVQCFGKEASAKLRQLLTGKSVKIQKDSIGDTRDKYQRLLRYISLNGTDINAQMIKEGYAYAYITYPFEKKDEYVKYEREAKEKKLGLWADGACGQPNIEPKAEQTSAVLGSTQEVQNNQGTSTQLTPQANAAPIQQTSQTEPADDTAATIGFWIVLLGGLLYWMIRKRRRKAKEKANLTPT